MLKVILVRRYNFKDTNLEYEITYAKLKTKLDF